METQEDEKIWVEWNTFYIGPHLAIQLKQESLSEMLRRNEEDQIALEQEAELHPDSCAWWEDWHACNCGAFNTNQVEPT